MKIINMFFCQIKKKGLTNVKKQTNKINYTSLNVLFKWQKKGESCKSCINKMDQE